MGKPDLIMEKQIKKIDAEHIAIIETTINERLVSKATLEARKVSLQEQIAEIDSELTNFTA